MSLLSKIKSEYKVDKNEMSLTDYLKLCGEDKMAYASSSERILKAIGKAEIVDTKDDPQLSRIHQNKKLRIYPAFSDFYGTNNSIAGAKVLVVGGGSMLLIILFHFLNMQLKD